MSRERSEKRAKVEEDAAIYSPGIGADPIMHTPIQEPLDLPELGVEVFFTPPVAKRGLFKTPQAATDQTPTPKSSPKKIAQALPAPMFTPERNNAPSPWGPIISPGIDAFIGRDALRQPTFGDHSPLPNSPPSAFFSPARVQTQPDAYATASETLLNYIRETLESEEIDTAEMLRIVTNAHASVSEAFKTLPEGSATLAELYQEFMGKLSSFIGLINHRQKQAEALTSDDLGFFLSTLSAPKTSIKVGSH